MSPIPPQLRPRLERIEKVAAIAFGRDPEDPDRAAPGWQRRLSAALGLSHGAVHATLKAGSSPVFDRKLRVFVALMREQMKRDIEELETLEHIFAASEGTVLPYEDGPSKHGDEE